MADTDLTTIAATKKEREDPCGNKECDLCYPMPRWKASRVVVLRREYFGEIKAPTLEEARARVDELWSGSYAQTGVEEQPAVIEPLDQESLEWHADYGAMRCFHTIRALDAVDCSTRWRARAARDAVAGDPAR
jgi:hypothetical protein